MGAIVIKFRNCDGPPAKRMRLPFATNFNTCGSQDTLAYKQNEAFQYSNWQNLPYVALVEIYSMLPNKDKFNMSLTCRSWSQPFSRPEVWKTVKFIFNCADDWRALRFVRTLASGVRHLSLEGYDRFGYVENHQHHNGRPIEDNLSAFLSSLLASGNSSLVTVELTKLKRLSNLSEWNLVKVLCDLLVRQTALRMLNISNFQLTKDSELLILQHVARGCGSSIQTLTIKEITQRTALVNAAREEIFADSFRHLSGLKELTLNQHHLSDRLLNALASDTPLESLHVFVMMSTEIHDNPSNKCWMRLTKAHPNLKVSYVLKIYGLESVIRKILTPGIPLFKLELQCSDLQGFACSEYMVYIAHNFQNYLQHLTVNVEFAFRWSQQMFAIIVEKCRQLETLTVTTSQFAFLEPEIQASFEKSVVTTLASQSSSQLRRFKVNGKEVTLRPSWYNSLVAWIIDHFN